MQGLDISHLVMAKAAFDEAGQPEFAREQIPFQFRHLTGHFRILCQPCLTGPFSSSNLQKAREVAER